MEHLVKVYATYFAITIDAEKHSQFHKPITQNRNKQKDHSSRNLWSLCPRAGHITYAHYAGSRQQLPFLANRKAELAVPTFF